MQFVQPERGQMATTKARNTAAIKNNSATLRYAGAADTANGPITNVPTLAEFAYHTGKYGGHIETGVLVGIGKALDAGTLAKTTNGEYVMKGINVTDTLAGVANNVLVFGASDYGRNSIHKSETDRRTALTSWKWTAGDPVVYTATRSTNTTTFNNDEAARPTRAVPGELVYRDGSPMPVQDEYSPKTG